MNRLFNTLRRIVERAPRGVEDQEAALPALPDFEERVEVLFHHAEHAAAYEDDLADYVRQLRARLESLSARIDGLIDQGRDQDAFEVVRIAARIRPQYDLVNQEIQAFHAVAGDLIDRVDRLIANLDEARALAGDERANPAATARLDVALTRLSRHFVMLERVAQARRATLPDRLAQQLTAVLDDRKLDLQLARYVLARRRALGPGRPSS
jgi:phage shock protein A